MLPFSCLFSVLVHEREGGQINHAGKNRPRFIHRAQTAWAAGGKARPCPRGMQVARSLHDPFGPWLREESTSGESSAVPKVVVCEMDVTPLQLGLRVSIQLV